MMQKILTRSFKTTVSFSAIHKGYLTTSNIMFLYASPFVTVTIKVVLQLLKVGRPDEHFGFEG